MSFAISAVLAIIALFCLLNGEWKLGILFVAATMAIQLYMGMGGAEFPNDCLTIGRASTC